MGESLDGHVSSKENDAGLMTKVLHGQKRNYLVSNILYDIHDNHWLSVITSKYNNPICLIPMIIVSNLRGLVRWVIA